MATYWSDIITAAMQVIDDVRWRDELAINAAQFFRAKSETLQFALPLLNKPPELLQHIEKDMVLPSYDDAVWVSTSDSTLLPTTVQTGKTGYDLCSVSERSEDGTAYFPYTNATYNSETGEVTFPVQPKAGVEYSIDFYTVGTFIDLTITQKRLFALAIAVAWDERFQRNWLGITAKVHDSSFNTPNESGYMNSSNARYIANKTAFEDELRAYEQKCSYADVVKNGKTVLI